MYKKAVLAAQDSLARVEDSIKTMERAENFKEFSKAWTDFLMPAGRIFSKLEEGSKSNSRSVAWFARRKHERKTDALLRYLRVARNADEHGLSEVARQKDGTIELNGDMILNGTIGGPNSFLHITQDGPRRPEIHITPGRIVLTTVVDKYKVPETPPASHMGTALSDPESPLEVAKLAHAYFAIAIEEAAKLPE